MFFYITISIPICSPCNYYIILITCFHHSISNLFIGLNTSLKSLGVSQNEVLKFSETITQAFKVSGASAVDTERALVQLNQAFSMGALRGQEYNSIVSAAPALLDYMADALGVAREKLNEPVKA